MRDITPPRNRLFNLEDALFTYGGKDMDFFATLEKKTESLRAEINEFRTSGVAASGPSDRKCA